MDVYSMSVSIKFQNMKEHRDLKEKLWYSRDEGEGLSEEEFSIFFSIQNILE